MTVVQNIEYGPDSTPAKGVKVTIRVGGVPAATASGTGTVVAATTVTTGADGTWSVNLFANSLLTPAGTWYIFDKRYPASLGGMRVEQFGVVPNSGSPVNFESIVVSEPDAPRLTESELTDHLAAGDPHDQYLLKTDADDLYEPVGGGGGGAPTGTAGGDLGGTYPNPTVDKSVVTSVRLDEMATPTADVAMGGQKLTNLSAAIDPTDALTKAALTTHEGASDPHVAAAYAKMVGGGRRVWVQDSTPSGASVNDGDVWATKSTAQFFVRNNSAWVASEVFSGAAGVGGVTPITPPIVDTDRTADIKLAIDEFVAEYVRSDGAVLQKESDNKIVSEGMAYELMFAVEKNDQVKFDLVNNWGMTHLRRSLNASKTTGKSFWAWSFGVVSNSVNDWNWATDSEYDRAIAYAAACQLWGRQSDYDNLNALAADLAAYTLCYDEGRAYQTTDEFQKAVGTGLTVGHHTNGGGGYVWEMNLSYCNPLAYRMLALFTSDPIWTQALNGFYDALTKATDGSGGLATATGLPPDWCDYSTNTHDVGPITSGTNAWAYTRSTNYGYDAFRTVYRVYQDAALYGEARATAWLSGNFKTFMRSEWTTNTAAYDGYTHTGTRTSSNKKNMFAYAAYWAIKTANPSDGVAATIKSSWLSNLKLTATGGYGTYFRNDPPGGATPTSTYFGNAWMILAEGIDSGLFANFANVSGIAGKYVAPGSSVGPVAPPTGAAQLYVDPNSNVQAYATSLSAGTKKTRFQWLASIPQVFWTGPEWDATGTAAIAYMNAGATAAKMPWIALYGIPGRDLSGASAGGSAGAAQYRNWWTPIVNAVGTKSVGFVLEPDSIAQMVQAVQGGTKTQADFDARMALIAELVSAIRQRCPNAKTYLDAAHSAWFPDPTPLIPGLRAAGVANTSGICCNVSNFRPDGEVIPWAKSILAQLNTPALGFIWDTGRNGKNPPPEGWDWGNPVSPTGKGVQFGRLPQYGGSTGDPKIHGWLYIKRAGESDGPFNGGPAAGVFWPAYLWTDGALDNSATAGMLQRPPTPSVSQ